jgi:hypothetical protein
MGGAVVGEWVGWQPRRAKSEAENNVRSEEFMWRLIALNERSAKRLESI